MKVNIRQIKLTFLILPVFCYLFIYCSSSKQFIAKAPIPDDRQHIDEPKVRNYNWVEDHIDMQFTEQLDQSFDLSRQLRNLFNQPKEAYNVNNFDEVENSSWFTNRNAIETMPLKKITKGPDTVNGPDTTSKWIIKKAKSEGVTPGFHIKDKKGNRYVIKFDPIGYSELVTGAEVVSTKLFYAAGYHVPENYIVYFHPDILLLGDKVKFTDVKGRNRYMVQSDLEEILDRVEHLPDGRIRALASKYIPGTPKGPFDYQGFRKDDPNDFIPHEHRRELRGLKILSAWLNHVDTKSGNSFDSYVTENGKSFIRHYLIDFGSTLGSGAKGPMEPLAGYINQIDPHEITLNIASLGFYVHDYEKLKISQYPSVGLFESKTFKPEKFKFYTPNPAFENCTDRDAFWGAKIVCSFNDEQLEKVVNQGQYSNTDAEKYILNTLKKRRDKIGQFYFNKICPLDNFKIIKKNSNYILEFVDLSIKSKINTQSDISYKYELMFNNKIIKTSEKITTNEISLLSQKEVEQIFSAKNNKYLLELKINTFNNSSAKTTKPVSLFISYNIANKELTLNGISR